MTSGRIDAHCHFWSLSRGDYGWLRADDPLLAPICRDFLPTDMAPLSTAAGIDRLVAVQAAPTEAESYYLLALAADDDAIAGVVGWADLAADDAPARIAQLAADSKLKGLRPMLQDLPDDDWINTAPTAAALDALEANGLRIDALVLPRHLLPLERFVRSRPSLPIVIDHAAKPALGGSAGDPRHAQWAEGMQRLAAFPHVRCKLSGLLTEMRPDQRATPKVAADALRHTVDQLLAWFGPQRLIWGSDWPVLTLAAGHADWLDVCGILLADLSETERGAIYGGNATQFYGLEAAA